MRRLQRVFFCVYLLFLVIGGGFLAYYLLAGPSHAPRPDLVVLPTDVPPAPRGFPTLNAMYLAFYLGQVDAIDAFGEIPVPEGVIERTDVEYGRVGDRPLLLDLYAPANLPEPAPGVIFIHGGGWEAGNKRDYKYYTVHFAQQGYVVATIGYRFKQEVGFPGCVEDAKCAVRWMRANAANLGVDPDRLAVIGGSAGGYLSMMTGYSSDVAELEGSGGNPGVSSAVTCLVNLYGPTDLTVPFARAHGTVTSFLKTSYDQDPGLFEKASPLHYVDAQDPPTLIIQGTIDDIVPVEQADALAEKLRDLGVPYWYARLDGWPHTLDLARPANEYVMRLTERFFDEFLRPKGQ